ncbi:MAG: hypothetical protein ABR567_00400 [Myxococcales bacterium]
MRRLALFALAFAAGAARADGLDRDTLLTDSPAVPNAGTVRVTGGATGSTSDASTTGGNNGTSGVSGSVSWTPIANVSGDVGAYTQIGASGGVSARVRYQFLSQARHGIDLSGGLRFKTISWHASAAPRTDSNGELEMLVAAGRRFGKFELVLNGVFGVETGGGEGKDIEAKGFAGWRFNDAVRAGLDSRLQAEVSDAENVAPGVATGRDYDLTAGPAVSWMATRTLQLQALIGVAQPKKTDLTTPVGVVSASIDF